MRSTKRNRLRDRRTNEASDLEQWRLDKRTRISEEREWHKQYPARVGYHGTDNEKELSPEE